MAHTSPGVGVTTTGVSPRSGGSTRLYVIFTLIIIAVLIGLDILFLAVINPANRLGHHYYLALGDSLTFGYQPDFNFTSGFADDVFGDIQKTGVTDLINYACAGDSTTTMIEGGCPVRLIHHDAYTGAQLDATLSFMRSHRGQINPVTLDIGSNDVLKDFDLATCQPTSTVNADLDTMDANLTHTIFPQLLDALASPTGAQTGNLFLLNYYNPFAKACPGSAPFIHILNDHLAADAAQFRVPVVDIYSAFGGDNHTADTICTYTWICNAAVGNDFHPTTQGYRLMADTVERALGYPGVGPASNPIQNAQPPIQSAPSAYWRPSSSFAHV
ncbi:MAG: hypothetical protein OJF49_003546 [Ktedonobacterales bacterium]|jgi:lysophospholipase L1-like esterase|nr:MAG: hypothetical protein OJF49_003546 [Ktedonobacterales bacterium]